MSDIIVIETHGSFAGASERAKQLATDHREELSIVRVDGAWQIQGPSWIRTFLAGKEIDDQEEEENRIFADYRTCSACSGRGILNFGGECDYCNGEGYVKE